MFSALLVFALSEEPLSWDWVKIETWQQYRSDFTIRYYGKHTTYNDFGWWPVFKVDNGHPQYILGTNEGKANYGKMKVWTKLSQPIDNKNYVLVQFFVKNEDDEPHYISIASHTDVQIAYNDYASVYWYQGNRGLTMKDDVGYGFFGTGASGVTLTLIVRDGFEVTNVDDFWFGQWNINNQHYWENRTDPGPLRDTDSAFSFGWRNRPVYPGRTEKFGVLLGIGDKNLNNPPKIYLKSHHNQNNSPNKEVAITVHVFEIDANQKVTLSYKFNGQDQDAGSFNSGNGNANRDIKFKVTLGPGVAKYPLQIWAKDNLGMKSNVIDLNLLVNEAPVLTIINQVSGKYSENSVVEIQGTIWDDTKAHISYQIDDHFTYDVEGDYVCNRTAKPFITAFLIKDKHISHGKHTLKIWATDEFGVRSFVNSFSFELTRRHTPEIRINRNGVPTYHKNELFEIKGKVRDLDYGDILSVYYLSPEIDSFQFVKTMSSNSGWMDFKVYYQVPHLTPNKTYNITFKVVDQTGASSLYDYYEFNYAKLPTPSPQPSPSPPVIPTLPPNYSGPTDYSTTISYTKSTTTDINGDPTFTYVPTNITFQITTDIPRRTPDVTTPAPSQTTEPSRKDAAIISEVKKKMEANSLQTWHIIAIGAAMIVLAIIIAVAIIVHEAKKEPADFNAEDAVMGEEDNVEVDRDNPLFNTNADADPFANDFELERENPPEYE